MGTIATLVPKVGETYACVLAPKFLDYGCNCNNGCNSEVLQFSICNMVVMYVQEFLKDQKKVQTLVQWSDPLVRALDGYAGERVSMRVSL